MKFKSFFQRRSNGRSSDSPSKREAATKDGKSPQETPEKTNSPGKSEDLPKPPTNHKEKDDTVLIPGNCTNCLDSTYFGVKKSVLVQTCMNLPLDLPNDRIGLNFEKKGMHVKEPFSMPSEAERNIKSPSEKVPELVETKDESDAELYEEVLDLKEKLVSLKSQYERDQAEWSKCEGDYLLVVRSAVRYREEAVKQLIDVGKDYRKLLEKYGMVNPMDPFYEGLLLKEDARKAVESKLETELSANQRKYLLDANHGAPEINATTQSNASTPETWKPTPRNSPDRSAIGNGAASSLATLEPLGGDGSDHPRNMNASYEHKRDQILSNWFRTLEVGRKDRVKAEATNHLLESYKDSQMMATLRKSYDGTVRNALLKWCQEQTLEYNVEITNFSSSWKDGLAAAALLHSLHPTAYNFHDVKQAQPLLRFQLAAKAAKELGVKSDLDIEGILLAESPNWGKILNFVKEVYIAVKIDENVSTPE